MSFIFCRTGIEETGPAKQGKKYAGGIFFRPWEIPKYGCEAAILLFQHKVIDGHPSGMCLFLPYGNRKAV